MTIVAEAVQSPLNDSRTRLTLFLYSTNLIILRVLEYKFIFMEEEIIQEEQTENSNSKPSYIWGIAGLAAFVILGGIGYCSWYIWIVVA